jgi:hypothetical protein
MEMLSTPKSTIDNKTWSGNNIMSAGPSLPRIVVESNEYMDQPLFVHPAEKPQNNDQGFRANFS